MINISHLSESELINLNEQVVKRIKALRRTSSSRMSSTLSVGDIVTWSRRAGHSVSGDVIKVNRTKAKVNVHGRTWTVPMSMLTVIS
jgi:hypothetical protein